MIASSMTSLLSLGEQRNRRLTYLGSAWYSEWRLKEEEEIKIEGNLSFYYKIICDGQLSHWDNIF